MVSASFGMQYNRNWCQWMEQFWVFLIILRKPCLPSILKESYGNIVLKCLFNCLCRAGYDVPFQHLLNKVNTANWDSLRIHVFDSPEMRNQPYSERLRFLRKNILYHIDMRCVDVNIYSLSHPASYHSSCGNTNRWCRCIPTDSERKTWRRSRFP